MARLSGVNGSFKLDGAEVKGVNEWTLNEEGPEKDVTGFDSGTHGDYLSMRPNATVSFSGHWDSAEAKMYGAPPALRMGATPVMQLWIDAAKYYSASSLITNMTVKVNVDESVDFNGTARITGDITYPTS